MRKIMSYMLPGRDCIVHAPLGSSVLSVGYSRRSLHVFMLGDDSYPTESRRFVKLVGESEVPKFQLRHVGTVVNVSNMNVEHVFEVSSTKSKIDELWKTRDSIVEIKNRLAEELENERRLVEEIQYAEDHLT